VSRKKRTVIAVSDDTHSQ